MGQRSLILVQLDERLGLGNEHLKAQTRKSGWLKSTYRPSSTPSETSWSSLHGPV